MATIFSDDFTTADGTLVGYNGWATHPTSVTNHIVTSNRAFPATANQAVSYNSFAPSTADYQVSVTLKTFTGATSYHGVLARASTSALSGYHARWNSGNVQLYKATAGSLTQLGSDVAKSVVDAGSYKLTLRCVGDQISVLWDDVVIIGPLTDATYSAAGSIVIRQGTQGAVYLDDVLVEDFAAGAAELAGTATASATATGDLTTTLAVKGVRVQLGDGSTPSASLTGLSVRWWDAEAPTGAPDYESDVETTDASGWLEIDLSAVTALAIGANGYLHVFKAGATAADDIVAAGRVPVSDIA